MATRKKAKTKPKTKPKVKKKAVAKKPVAKKKPKSKPAPKRKAAPKKKQPVFEEAATQKVPIAEVLGDIEEQLALDLLIER
ncbi:MAG: hypothetical protein GQE15_13890 [Archangiaceae bacterium]|nr:hypothetical protein [Archangiaceae bacterium]